MSESNLTPQNKNWYKDLPLFTEEHSQSPSIDTSGVSCLNYIDKNYCELSRSNILFRAPILMLFLFSFFFFLFIFLIALPWYFSNIYPESEMKFFVVIYICIGVLSLLMAIWSFRFGTQIPFDTPVRFNVVRQKVYVYEFTWSTNFLVIKHWPTVVKVFDWADIRAEITRTSSYTGTVYMMRQSLVCAVCKPGTNEVIDRFTLHGHATTDTLAQIWHYCCVYMEQGIEALPDSKLNDSKITWNNSILAIAPYFSFGSEGRGIRNKMNFLDTIQAMVLILVFPITLILILGDYISMRVSPKAKWPEGIDVESRTVD